MTSSVIVCKAVALAIVLLFLVIKNMKFKKESQQWNRWFHTIYAQKLTVYNLLMSVRLVTFYKLDSHIAKELKKT